jgi:hypothetical protein
MIPETVSKGRPVGGRPAGGSHKPATEPDTKATTTLGDMLEQQREEQVREQLMLEAQREQYDFKTEERAELDREYNNTRDLILAQLKSDDEIVKKYISMI